jgi:transaldolase
MQIFLDTADTRELAELAETGLVDGVTTNPSLIAKAGRPILETIKEICAIVPGPVSAEAVASDVKGMLAEAAKLRAVAPNVVIKVPLTMDGLKACRALSADGAKVNVTLCFSAPQALLAAKAGAAFISPFIGRLDDGAQDGMELIEQIHAIYERYDFETNILAASVRTVAHVRDAALAGADCATIPPAIFRSLYKHALTDAGLAAFMKDWNAAGQKIL